MGHGVQTSDHILDQCLVKFFESNEDFFSTMHSICDKQRPLSLRVLDWLCTNFSKSRQSARTSGSKPEIYHQYKNNLKGFGKKHFDPFCRKTSFVLKLHGKSMQTTYGQLNFFRWAFENDIVDFAVKNRCDIEDDMNTKITKSKQRSEKPQRTQLSTLASNHCHKRIKKIRVSFC